MNEVGDTPIGGVTHTGEGLFLNGNVSHTHVELKNKSSPYFPLLNGPRLDIWYVLGTRILKRFNLS